MIGGNFYANFAIEPLRTGTVRAPTALHEFGPLVPPVFPWINIRNLAGKTIVTLPDRQIPRGE